MTRDLIPDDATVERCAKAMYRAAYHESWRLPWTRALEATRNYWRRLARVALTEALQPAPEAPR